MKTSISKAAKPYKIWKQPRALSRRFVFPSLFLERLHKSCESNAFLHKKSTYNRYIPTKFSLHVYLYHMKTVMQKWQFLVHPLWKKAGNERVDRIGAKILSVYLLMEVAICKYTKDSLWAATSIKIYSNLSSLLLYTALFSDSYLKISPRNNNMLSFWGVKKYNYAWLYSTYNCLFSGVDLAFTFYSNNRFSPSAPSDKIANW